MTAFHPAIAGGETWQRAVHEYIERLRAHYGDRLAAVVLFGSRARGDADQYSDVDLLVALRGEFDGRDEQGFASERAHTLSEEYDYVLLFPIVATEHDYRRRMLPLFMNIRREGIELWPGEPKAVRENRGTYDDRPTDEDLQTVIAKATEALREAEYALEGELFNFTANRAYYAMFHAATAVLLVDGLAFSRHSRVIAEFNRRYVNTGRFKMPGKTLDDAFDARNIADYAYAEHVSRELALELVRSATAFVAEADRLLGQARFG